MKKELNKVAVIALSGAMCAGAFSACGKDEVKVADPQAVIALVNGEEMKAGVAAIPVRYQQMYMESIYRSYMGTSAAASWDQTDEGSTETRGQLAVTDGIEQMEKLYLIRAHAADYSVELSEEEKGKIQESAAAFAEANTEILSVFPTDEACVAEYLELNTYQKKVHDAIILDVDREVSEEEAQQTTLTYVLLEKPEEVEETAEAEEDNEVVEEVGEVEEVSEEEATEAAEEEAEEAAEETTEATEEAAEEEAQPTEEELKAYADEILAKMLEDPTSDMNEVASGVYEKASASTASYSTNDDTDTRFAEEIKEAVKDLKDGEMVPAVITTEEGFYVIRLDAAMDEEATASKKDSIIAERENELYNTTVDEWAEAAELEIKDDVKAGIIVDSARIFYATSQQVDTSVIDEALEDGTEEIADDAEVIELDDAEENSDIDEAAEIGGEEAEEAAEEEK